MRSRPDSMERWGVVDIFTEAAALLHRHFRLFVPFFFAFCLPASFRSVFQIVFLKVAAAPPLETPSIDFNSTALSTITQILYNQMQPKLILTYTLWLLGFLLDNLALAAFTYIVAHVYSNVDTESDNDSIVKAVMKLLRPRIFYRICMTDLWGILVCIPVNVAWLTVVSILFGISPSGVPKAFTFFNIEVSDVIGFIAVTIMLALAEPIALLEPEKYGRAALQLGFQYVKRRPGTTFCIAIFSVTTAELGFASAQAVANLGLSLWVKIIAASLLSILSSVVRPYVWLVFLVMYFVCKSSFEAVLPTFQHSSTKVKSAADGMEMVLPDGIARWGLGAILKEAGRLIRRHFRLFMPFFLAFQLPASLLPVFHIMFLIAGSRPSLHSKSIANATSPELFYMGPQIYYQSVANSTGPSFSFKNNVNGTDLRLLYEGPALFYASLVNDQGPEVHYKRLLVNGTLHPDELCYGVSQLYYKSFNNSPELYDKVPQLYYKSLGNGSTGESEVFDLVPQFYYKVPSQLYYKDPSQLYYRRLANGTGSQLFKAPQLYYKNFDNGTALELYNKAPQLYYDQTFSNGTSSQVFDKVPQLYYEVPPLRFKSFVNGTTAQGGNSAVKMASTLQPSFILAACTLWVLRLFFSTLTLAAFTYIVPSIYSKADTKPDNDLIIKSVFKLVPHAFLRILLTGTWEMLVWIPVAIAGAIAVRFGGSSGATPTFILFVVMPFVIAIIGIMVVFMLAESIAVFEAERNGRAALKQSCKYAKGRPGTILCIVIFSKLMGELNSFALNAVAEAGLPVLVKIIVEIVLGILNSVVSAYIALVGVVVFLVCKSYSEPVHTE